MKEIVKKGKTVDDAVEAALAELGVSRDEVLIDVISEGSKGVFGIGSKDAEVLVKLDIKTPEDTARDFLEKVTKGLGLDAEIDITLEDNIMNINFSGEDMGVIIGRRGETLTSLQYLTSLVVNKTTEDFIRVSLDTENYKQRREESLIRLANKTADKVVKYRHNMSLDPMNPYERRIVHSCLQSNELVSTFSTGEEPNRRVVITLKRQ